MIDCPFLKNNICGLANKICGKTTEVTQEECGECLQINGGPPSLAKPGPIVLKIIRKQLHVPSILKQTINFTKASIKHAVDGFKNVPEEELRARLEICEKCEFMTNDRHCSKCGCPVDDKAKWRSEKCPENRWALPMVENKPRGGCGCGS